MYPILCSQGSGLLIHIESNPCQGSLSREIQTEQFESMSCITVTRTDQFEGHHCILGASDLVWQIADVTSIPHVQHSVTDCSHQF